MKLNAKKIGKKIKSIRTQNGMSQEKFAETIQSTPQTVSNIETGKVIPNTQTLANISSCCNVSINEIVGVCK